MAAAIAAYNANPCRQTREALSRASIEYPAAFAIIDPFDLCSALCRVFLAAFINNRPRDVIKRKMAAFGRAVNAVPVEARDNLVVGLWSWYGELLADTPYKMDVRLAKYIQRPALTPIADLIAARDDFYRTPPPPMFCVEAVGDDLLPTLLHVYWVTMILRGVVHEPCTEDDEEEGLMLENRIQQYALQRPPRIDNAVYEVLLGPGEREAYKKRSPISKDVNAEKAFSTRNLEEFQQIKIALRNLRGGEQTEQQEGSEAPEIVELLQGALQPVLNYAKWYGEGWAERHIVWDAAVVARDLSREKGTIGSTHAYLWFGWGGWWAVCPKEQRLKGPMSATVAIAAMARMESYTDDRRM